MRTFEPPRIREFLYVSSRELELDPDYASKFTGVISVVITIVIQARLQMCRIFTSVAPS